MGLATRPNKELLHTYIVPGLGKSIHKNGPRLIRFVCTASMQHSIIKLYGQDI
jgi:hypothetical protein